MTTEMLATCWTHSGNSYPHPDCDVSNLDLLDRAEAAAEAGFVGFGIFGPDLRVALQQNSIAKIGRRFQELGLKYLELEFLTDWWCAGERRAAADAERDFLLEAAEALGARHVKVGAHINKADDGAELPALDLAMLGPALHELAAHAQRHNTRLAVEFLPMSDVSDVGDGIRLIEAADHPAVGVCVDIWHFERGPSSLAEIAAIPADKVIAVELSDARAEIVGGPYEDTIHHRLFPGEGAFELSGFIDAIRATGFDGPWGVEILSAPQRERPVDAILRDAYRTTAELLSK